MNRAENRRKFRFWTGVLILFAVIAGWLNLPDSFVNFVIAKIALGPILGIITGAISAEYAELLDRLTHGILKEEWVYEIFGQEIHIPIFVLVTVIIELLLFK